MKNLAIALFSAAALSAGAANASTVIAYTGSAVTWTAPVSGLYNILAYGAEGGAGGLIFYYGLSPDSVGGAGALMGGDFVLSQGQLLTIIVGGQGGNAGSDDRGGGGGGGGGSFVLDGSTGTPLVIAGGGGGGGGSTGIYFGSINGEDGRPGGLDATSGTRDYAGSGGSFGQGGDVNQYTVGPGGAGGGLYTGGASTYNNYAEGGKAAGGQGGAAIYAAYKNGGFGGGGGGGYTGGGGGGGYSGGGGGGFTTPRGAYFTGGGGGGGGSINQALENANFFAAAGVRRGNGEVDIRFLGPVPEPATWVIMLSGFGIVGAALRRRRTFVATSAKGAC